VIDREIREALSDLRLIRVREMHLSRLQALFDGEPLDSPVVVCGVGGWSGTDILTDPERWLEEVLESMAQYVDVALDDRVFRPLCLEGWLYGVHFTDRVFGAPVHFAFDQWWSVALETPVGQLPRPDLTTHETWVQASAAEPDVQYLQGQVVRGFLRRPGRREAGSARGDRYPLRHAQVVPAVHSADADAAGLYRWALPATRFRSDVRLRHPTGLAADLP
jgi:hypothetical protein